jgi:glycosyltransferase involved in cell wall biosynthesis
LADAIAVLMENEDLRRRLGQAARKLVSGEFSSARIGRDIVALYARALAGPSGAGAQLRERAAS